MGRLIAPNGATVNVSDEKAERLLGEGYKAPGSSTTADSNEAPSLTKLDKAGLQAEAEKRGLPTTGTKPELLAAIQEADAKASEASTGNEPAATGADGSTPNE